VTLCRRDFRVGAAQTAQRHALLAEINERPAAAKTDRPTLPPDRMGAASDWCSHDIDRPPLKLRSNLFRRTPLPFDLRLLSKTYLRKDHFKGAVQQPTCTLSRGGAGDA
jgi:hypothetical protein